MNDPRPWRTILDAIGAAVDADADAATLGVTLASRWVANLATPAILVVPVTRQLVRPADIRWGLALQVVVNLAGDDDEPMHALLDLALPALPAGVIPGDTTYGQDERAGGTYIVSTTTLVA